ncbi:unnamed protein product [Calypogeia fissa]
MPFTCFKCNGHGHIARDCRKKEPSNNPAGVGYPESRDTILGRRRGPNQLTGRPVQYHEQHFTSTGTLRQYRDAERTIREEGPALHTAEGGRADQNQQAEERRFEVAPNQEWNTNYVAGHTPTAPMAMSSGAEDNQPSLKTYTPPYRTTSELHNTHTGQQAADFGKAAQQNIVVTPLVHKPDENSADGGVDTNMIPDDTPDNRDIEITRIDQHELMRFRLWEKQGGRKQDERSPGTPSHQQKAAPANKKNRKSSSDLFPAPRDVTPNWQRRAFEKEVATSSLSDTVVDLEMLVDVSRENESQNAEQMIFGTPGRRGEEHSTPPIVPSNRKTLSWQ